eukprot:TRINITY_DN10532_c0_g1_i1.p1 TRINITY_DN10532_c0_g1~~TRINITY_DN10532_c0_g1_i1.p1  ORF type:complete len:300 (+),score=54.15 TRINITY_DN10532_c0_g1_i1:45-902(+)
MSGFCFDFGDQPETVDKEEVDTERPDALQWEISLQELDKLLHQMGEEDLKTRTEAGVRMIQLRASMLTPEECAFAGELKTSDIINGVYEGGFKLWSCAGDLCRYLQSDACDFTFEGKTVLEAGCGHGIPAITALLRGSREVIFQDYNKEVLQHLTIPNVIVNGKKNCSTLIPRCRFWSGDWRDLSNKCSTTVDIILSTDTLYTIQSTKALVQFIEHKLSYPNGFALIGSKTLYFGCGGGITELEEVLEKKYSQSENTRKLILTRVLKIEDGVDNVREIIKLSWKQ